MFPPKFKRKDYPDFRAKWITEGFTCPPSAHLNTGRYWKEFPVMDGRKIHVWYKKVADYYVRDYGLGKTKSVAYNYDWPKP